MAGSETKGRELSSHAIGYREIDCRNPAQRICIVKSEITQIRYAIPRTIPEGKILFCPHPALDQDHPG